MNAHVEVSLFISSVVETVYTLFVIISSIPLSLQAQ